MFDFYYKDLKDKVGRNKFYVDNRLNIVKKVINHFNELSSEAIEEFSVFEKYYNFLYNYNIGNLPQHTSNTMRNFIDDGEDILIFEKLDYFTGSEVENFKKYGCVNLPPYNSQFIDIDYKISLDFLYYYKFYRKYNFKYINVESILQNNNKLKQSKPFNEVYFNGFSLSREVIDTLDGISVFEDKFFKFKLFKFLLNSSDIYLTILFEMYKYFRNIQKLPKRVAKAKSKTLIDFVEKEFKHLKYPIEYTISTYNTLLIPESIEKLDNLEKLTLTKEYNTLTTTQQKEVLENVIFEVFVLNNDSKEESKKMIYNLIEKIF